MGPSVGRGEDTTSTTTLPHHRYYTRSSREQNIQAEYCESQDARGYPRLTDQSKPRYIPPTRNRRHSDPVNQQVELEQQDSEALQLDMMMDQVSYATSNSVRAPFPSPSMKSTTPFYPFPTTQGTQIGTQIGGDGVWGHRETTWHQGASGDTCILVEAANRAQMAILVDDMGSMGIEQMEHS
jgi:hypothetical protein